MKNPAVAIVRLRDGILAPLAALRNRPKRWQKSRGGHIRQAMGGAQSGQDVDMIAGSAHCMRHAVEAANHAAEVFVDTGAWGGREPWLAIFGAKDEMVMQREMGRGHAGVSRAPARAQSRAERFETGGYGRCSGLHPPQAG